MILDVHRCEPAETCPRFGFVGSLGSMEFFMVIGV